ncbi:MAG: DNA polymerase III subunit alpha [Candidatus Stahlbacteria bacterium]|nr:DNA polymerase III subunit alpha [Candidatus Stahlbacteria bacterium]
MPHAKFVHLHLHTDYSLLDGANKIDKIAALASHYSLPALAITDHGNIFGAIEFYKTMESAGIKPIIGEEAYMAPTNMTERHTVDGVSAFHLTLLVKNEHGYKNLMYLSSMGFSDGFYYHPRIDRSILKEYSNGLIGLSGCLKGEIPYYIKKGNLKRAQELAEEYLSIFGPGNFYLELMRLGLKDNDIINDKIIELSNKLGIPLVATNDCHYLTPADVEAHDILLCLQTHHNLDDEKRLKFDSKELYFKSPDEMIALFSDYPQAIENTVHIAEQCNLHLKLDPTKITVPCFPLPEGYTSADDYLAALAMTGLKQRYPNLTKPILERFEYELSIIKRTGYSAYFLIIKDLIDTAISRDIPVGPGRGSTVGSLICYCLGITQLDPLRYHLIFERFLNPDRVSPPDIDIDFGDERRDEVIQYLRERYGKESVCQIITFGTMASRAAIRDVGRVLKISLPLIDRLAKAIPQGETIEDAIKLAEVQGIVNSNPELNKLIDIASKLEGIIRHASTHAAGIAIVPGKLTDFVPLFCAKGTSASGGKSNEGNTSTQYSMKSLELLGIVKIDILGLRTLTVIDNTMRSLALQSIPMGDTKTFHLLKKGATVGVFQLESEGMQDILRKFGPTSIEDIMAVLALYRPGPLGGLTKDKFIKSKHGEEPITYLHPLLEPILYDTYGVILYQEQVMQIASVVAGFTLGEADILRRAMGKKIPEIMDEKSKSFIDGAKKRGVSEEIANELFKLILHFAGYGFNKSHSAGYAMLSYQTAWLKANHPACFMANTLTSEFQDTDRIKVLIDECRRMKLEILPPDINLSDVDFKPEATGRAGSSDPALYSIRFGLAAIKNLGPNAALECIKRRPFKSFTDFLKLTSLHRNACESLIKAGAFDTFDTNRKKLLELLDKKDGSQRGLFDDGKKEQPKEEWARAELLLWEKDAFGFYFSGHPLEKYKDEMEAFATCLAHNVLSMQQDEEVVIGGVVAKRKYMNDKDILFLTIEDFSGMVEVVAFSDVPDAKSVRLEEEILVKGMVTHRNDRVSVRASKIIPLSKAKKELIGWVDIWIPVIGLEESTMVELHKILAEIPGECNVFLHLVGDNSDPSHPGTGKEEVVLKTQVKVTPKRALLSKVKKLLGEKSIKIGGPAI